MKTITRLFAIISLVCLAGCGDGLTPEERLAERQTAHAARVAEVEALQPIEINYPEISSVLHWESSSNEIQKERMIERLEGQVVELLVNAIDVSISDSDLGTYEVEGGDISGYKFKITITPTTESERSYIENLNYPKSLRFKGRVTRAENRIGGVAYVEDAVLTEMF